MPVADVWHAAWVSLDVGSQMWPRAGMCISLQDVLGSLSDCSAQSAILVAM